MPKKQTTSFELLLDLESRPETTRGRRLQGALRHAVRSGRLPGGAPLPSTRALAADLAVSRSMVVEAYDQLVAEGYLVAVGGSGTRVAEGVSHRPEENAGSAATEETNWQVDFGPGHPDLGLFPRAAWTSAIRDAAASAPDPAFGYGHPAGTPALRTAIAGHVRRVRGAVADADNVVITNGFTNGLALLARTLRSLGATTVAVEDPGAYEQRNAMVASGLSAIPVPVDGHGIVVDALEGEAAVLVTPAHQYPTGVVMTPDRRARLIAWAGESDASIIEDDYDAEFRYDRSPIGCMQGLAPDRVILGGSVSKTLAPSIRLGWLVVPDRLADAVIAQQAVEGGPPPALPQFALASLLVTGRYDRHIRRSRVAYRRRRDILVAALSGVPGVELRGVAAGLHLVVELPEGVDARLVSDFAAEAGVRVPGLADYRSAPGPGGLVMGYAHLSESQLSRGAETIAEAIARVT